MEVKEEIRLARVVRKLADYNAREHGTTRPLSRFGGWVGTQHI